MEFKFVMGLFVLLALVYSTTAAIARSEPSENKDYPGKCWDASTKTAYPKGTNYPKGKCTELICGDDLSYEIHTCSPVGVSAEYELKTDATKTYPGCCPTPMKKQS